MDLISYLARNVIVMDTGVTSPSSVAMAPDSNGARGWGLTSPDKPDVFDSNPHEGANHDHSIRTETLTSGKNGRRTANGNRRYSSDGNDRPGNEVNGNRRYSVGDLRRSPESPYCFISHGHTSFSDIAQISWSEYTARKSLVKFRNRRAASYRSRDHHGGMPPSALAVRVLSNQYEVCRDMKSPISQRIMAVFYCWYFGWITDVYNGLTHGGAERSFFRWMLSCVLVSFGASVLVGLACLLTHGLLLALTYLLHSGLTFMALLVIVFILILALVTILSYSSHHGNQSDNSTLRRMRKATKQKRF